MTEEILVNVTPQETRVAVLENGMLQQIFIERVKNKGIVGNVYMGKVVRVLPGMQAAFVEIGLERTAFLHARDLCFNRGENGTNTMQQCDQEIQISSLLTEGQKIVVQVIKDPIGTKGARLTSQISIPSRNLVYLPGQEYIGISQRIQDPESRDRLLTLMSGLQEQLEPHGGFILRTAAETTSKEEIQADIEFLTKVWERIQRRKKAAPVPSLIHEDIPLGVRIIRDLMRDEVEKIKIDSRETVEIVNQFAQELVPEAVSLIEHYPGDRPIFELYGVEDEIQKALANRVPLKSGGYLIIDQTEALTTIDINTGSYVGKRNLEDTIFKTNLEATAALARQIRVRNLGGIIIVDFIDMADPEHCQQVMRSLEREIEKDRTKTHVNDMTSLGLVEITRKRTCESLERLLTESCPACSGRGTQKTVETCCYEIFREIIREERQFNAEKYLVVGSTKVIDMLLEEESTGLADLQDFIGKTIELQPEPSYHQEQYDVVLL